MLAKSVGTLILVNLIAGQSSAQAVGQADVLIQSLTVNPSRGRPTMKSPAPLPTPMPGPRGSPVPLPVSEALDIQVVVFSYWDDDAQNVILNIFLPPEARALTLPTECAAPVSNNGSTGVSNAFVTCQLGSMAVQAIRTVTITISRPPSFVVPRVGVFAWSETPDPNTGNNHAQAVAP